MTKTPPALVLLLAITSLLAAACGPRTDARENGRPTEPLIDASEIAAHFERDEAGASRLYEGKHVRIAGYVSAVEELDNGALTLTLKTSQSTFRPVRCVMKNADALDDMQKLEPGTPVSVSGRVGGFIESTYYVLLEDCATH